MASEYPVGRRYRITTADHGKFPTLGDVSKSEGGAWHVTFVPDDSFVGTIAFVGRSNAQDETGKRVADDSGGFGSIPYRRVTLAGVASDNKLVTDVNSSGVVALVPADGMSVALLVECTAGFAYVYSRPLTGAMNASV